MRFGVRDRGVRHGLFVMCPIGRQLAPVPVERLADARNVAVTENREHAAEERDSIPGVQRGEIANKRLRGREPHWCAPTLAARTAKAAAALPPEGA